MLRPRNRAPDRETVSNAKIALSNSCLLGFVPLHRAGSRGLLFCHNARQQSRRIAELRTRTTWSLETSRSILKQPRNSAEGAHTSPRGEAFANASVPNTQVADHLAKNRATSSLEPPTTEVGRKEISFAADHSVLIFPGHPVIRLQPGVRGSCGSV